MWYTFIKFLLHIKICNKTFSDKYIYICESVPYGGLIGFIGCLWWFCSEGALSSLIFLA